VGLAYHGPLLATFEYSTDCTCCDFGHLRFYFILAATAEKSPSKTVINISVEDEVQVLKDNLHHTRKMSKRQIYPNHAIWDSPTLSNVRKSASFRTTITEYENMPFQRTKQPAEIMKEAAIMFKRQQSLSIGTMV
jgi:hypothetical protein